MKDLKSINKKINSLTLILDNLKQEKFRLEVVAMLEVQTGRNLQELIRENTLDADLYLTTQQVCIKYNICRSTLERAIRSGLKYSSRKKGGNRLYKKLDLDAYFYSTNK